MAHDEHLLTVDFTSSTAGVIPCQLFALSEPGVSFIAPGDTLPLRWGRPLPSTPPPPGESSMALALSAAEAGTPGFAYALEFDNFKVDSVQTARWN